MGCTESLVQLQRSLRVWDSALGQTIQTDLDSIPIEIRLPVADGFDGLGPPELQMFEAVPWASDVWDLDRAAVDFGWRFNDVARVNAVGVHVDGTDVSDERLEEALQAWSRRLGEWSAVACGELARSDVRQGTRWFRLRGNALSHEALPIHLTLSVPTIDPAPLKGARLQAVIDRASRGEDAPVAHLLATDAEAILVQQKDYRRAVIDGATAVEHALWLYLAKATEDLPQRARDHLMRDADRATMGKLLAMVRSLAGPPASSLTDDHLVTLRNSVVHRQAVQPTAEQAREMVATAVQLLSAIDPLPDDLRPGPGDVQASRRPTRSTPTADPAGE